MFQVIVVGNDLGTSKGIVWAFKLYLREEIIDQRNRCLLKYVVALGTFFDSLVRQFPHTLLFNLMVVGLIVPDTVLAKVSKAVLLTTSHCFPDDLIAYETYVDHNLQARCSVYILDLITYLRGMPLIKICLY